MPLAEHRASAILPGGDRFYRLRAANRHGTESKVGPKENSQRARLPLMCLALKQPELRSQLPSTTRSRRC